MNPYLNLNFKIDVDIIKNDISNLNFYRHGFNMPSCYLPEMYTQSIREIFNLPDNHYMAIHNLEPIVNLRKEDIPYLTRWHIDGHRKSAIMIPVSDDNANHYTEFLIDSQIKKAPYTQGVPLLFDVKKIHKVTNKDSKLSRNIIAIGLVDCPFAYLIKLHEDGKLINYDKFQDNIFNPMIIENEEIFI